MARVMAAGGRAVKATRDERAATSSNTRAQNSVTTVVRPKTLQQGHLTSARVVYCPGHFSCSQESGTLPGKDTRGRDTVDDIQLDYAVPSSDLADYVTLFYDFLAEVPVFEDVERADHGQIRFRLSAGPATYHFPDGTAQASTEFHVLGPGSGARAVRAEGPVAVFGMGVTAAGWAAMIGADASTMLNRMIDATSLFGAGRLQVAGAALRKAQGIAARVSVGEALVRDLMRSGDGLSGHGARGFVRQVNRWLAGSPSPEMADLIAATGLSRRQIERKCNVLYGAPPKLLARKFRALRAAVAMVAGEETPRDALERGFYDQSHMIREIKQFTGLTPGQIRSEPNLLARLTITHRSALGGVVSPLISGT